MRYLQPTKDNAFAYREHSIAAMMSYLAHLIHVEELYVSDTMQRMCPAEAWRHEEMRRDMDGPTAFFVLGNPVRQVYL